MIILYLQNYLFLNKDKDLSYDSIFEFVYKRYTLDEIKRRVIDILSQNSTGMSSMEIAEKIQVNRMTITKYLNILSSKGLLKQRKIGSVNLWTLESGVSEIGYPIDYSDLQQKFIDRIFNENVVDLSKLLINIINSEIGVIKIYTELIIPTINTINELYTRGRLGKTERIVLLNKIDDLVTFLQFSISQEGLKITNFYGVFISGNNDQDFFAKLSSIAFRSSGWNSFFIGNLENQIDPFFDIDFTRYLTKSFLNKKGYVTIFIFVSTESSLRFLYTTIKSFSDLHQHITIVLYIPEKLKPIADQLEVENCVYNFNQLLNYSESVLKKFGLSNT